ncbi:RING finger protein 39 isoform X1 [Mesoplodon densirostris]|uniref:RING finger protein 39 isoform X1 n=1 Tax=Mesoplodon densirostris TaxID=48708 RepID=UPI0028DB64C7|nr:RING finger protein 39 isoform X1 [Mesoplodon densirostris]
MREAERGAATQPAAEALSHLRSPKVVPMVAEGTAPGRWLPMEASELLGRGLVQRLEQLATCPLCGGPFEDPVLLVCEHSFCRACLDRRWGTPPAPGPEAPPTACPCCGQPCPRRSLRSNVRLAVEVRISRGLREKLADPGARAGKRRGGRVPTMGCLDPHGEGTKKTWRRFDAPTPKSSNSEDDLSEDYPVVKKMLHRLTADLTLDPGTAHRRLLVSADRRSVRLAPPGTPAPRDGPARFDQLLAVLGAQGFGAGRHCWEVEIADTASRGDSSGEDEDDGESRYALGAAGESVRRKGRVGLCPAGAVWAVEGRGGRLWALTSPEPTPLGGAGPQPRRIRVDLDWERGRVAFYDGRSLDLLFAFQAPGPLGERVFPLLCTRDPRVPLCLVPAEG